MTYEKSVKMIESNDTQMQIFMKSVSNNSIIERDRLLEYTTASFYNELSIFLKMNKRKN